VSGAWRRAASKKDLKIASFVEGLDINRILAAVAV
jgi:hypothetical protein